MTPEGLLYSVNDDSKPIRERLDNRMEEIDTQLADSKEKINTASRTLKKLKLQSRLFSAAQRRQTILNRIRGLTNLKIKKLDTTTSKIMLKTYQTVKKEYNKYDKQANAIKKEIKSVEKERDKILSEAEELAKARSKRILDLKEKREKAEEASLDYTLKRQEIEEERLQQLKDLVDSYKENQKSG